jgi:hypothetical protein
VWPWCQPCVCMCWNCGNTGTVSDGSRVAGHWISFWVTLAAMVVVNVVMAYTLDRRRHMPSCQRYGPLCLTLFASPLIMADLIRHVLQDADIWKPCCGTWVRDSLDSSAFSLPEVLCHVVCGFSRRRSTFPTRSCIRKTCRI